MTGVAFDHVESERLVLKRFEDRDLVPLLACRNDPVVARYQGWKSVSEREARDMIRQLERERPGAPGGWFQFATALKSADDLIHLPPAGARCGTRLNVAPSAQRPARSTAAQLRG